MSKRKLADELEEDWDNTKKIKNEDYGLKKHSLDSDEEDSYEVNKEIYDVMHDDDIEGQEDGVAGRDGDVQITPFNMKEELEEGHFDTEGNYHWKKDKEIRDNWLENIDWVKVKDVTQDLKHTAEDDSMDSSIGSPFDTKAAYKAMLEFMAPGENVTKTLKRLGGNKSLSASERLKRKKAGISIESSGDSGMVTQLTEIANSVLTKTGNMDIYQYTYKQLCDLVNAGGSKSTSKTEDVLDMYADDFDEKEKKRIGENSLENKDENCKEEEVEQIEPKELMWEYKLEKDSNDVKGPHTTEQMQKYVDTGFFKAEIWVRKVGQDGAFYSSKRIDFELYL